MTKNIYITALQVIYYKHNSVKLVFHICLFHLRADWCLISQRGTPRFSVRFFIWPYWLRFSFFFFTLLHPDSIKNGLVAPFHDWRPYLSLWSVVSVVTNDKPYRSFGGITQKTKFERVRAACLQVRMSVTCNAWLPRMFGSVIRANFNSNN